MPVAKQRRTRTTSFWASEYWPAKPKPRKPVRSSTLALETEASNQNAQLQGNVPSSEHPSMKAKPSPILNSTRDICTRPSPLSSELPMSVNIACTERLIKADQCLLQSRLPSLRPGVSGPFRAQGIRKEHSYSLTKALCSILPLYSEGLLKGSWDLVTRVITRVTILITPN